MISLRYISFLLALLLVSCGEAPAPTDPSASDETSDSGTDMDDTTADSGGDDSNTDGGEQDDEEDIINCTDILYYNYNSNNGSCNGFNDNCYWEDDDGAMLTITATDANSYSFDGLDFGHSHESCYYSFVITETSLTYANQDTLSLSDELQGLVSCEMEEYNCDVYVDLFITRGSNSYLSLNGCGYTDEHITYNFVQCIEY